jgi:hypothetical protein
MNLIKILFLKISNFILKEIGTQFFIEYQKIKKNQCSIKSKKIFKLKSY